MVFCLNLEEPDLEPVATSKHWSQPLKDQLQVNNDHVQYITIYYYKPEGLSESTHTSVGCPPSSPPLPLSLFHSCCIAGVMGHSHGSHHPHNCHCGSHHGSHLHVTS